MRTFFILLYIGRVPGTPFRQYYSASQPASNAASAASSPSRHKYKLKEQVFRPKLIIFDKDGTLVCFHTMWAPWCTSLADRYAH